MAGDLSSLITPLSVTSTGVDASRDIITKAAHGLVIADTVYATASVDGLTAEQIYYVCGLKKLSYDGEVNPFTEGLVVTGGTSAATGIVALVVDGGSSGDLYLRRVRGEFIDNEPLTDTGTGGATTNGRAEVDPDRLQLCASLADLYNGVVVDLTGTTNLTLKKHIDPLNGVYVTRDADAIDGSEGAFQRLDFTGKVLDEWFGGSPDVANNGVANQAMINFARNTGGGRGGWNAGSRPTQLPMYYDSTADTGRWQGRLNLEGEGPANTEVFATGMSAPLFMSRRQVLPRDILQPAGHSVQGRSDGRLKGSDGSQGGLYALVGFHF